MILDTETRVCLKIAFHPLCVPVCGKFGPNEGRTSGGKQFSDTLWALAAPDGTDTARFGMMGGNLYEETVFYGK